MPYQAALGRAVEQIGGSIIGVGFAASCLVVDEDTSRTVVAQKLLTVSTTTPDQVIAWVVAVFSLNQRWQLPRLVNTTTLSRANPSTSIIGGTRFELALSALHFAVQTIPLEVANDLTIEIQLMQVATAVVQAIEPPTIGQAGLNQVSQFVVTMLHRTGRALFL